MVIYFHPQPGTPGTGPAAVEGKEISLGFLDSLVDKRGPLVGTSGKDLPVSHRLPGWEPWPVVLKAHSNTRSHIS